MGKRRGGRKMATQMAATPTVYGKEAQKIVEAAKKKTSAQALKNGEKLVNYFSRFEKWGRLVNCLI